MNATKCNSTVVFESGVAFVYFYHRGGPGLCQAIAGEIFNRKYRLEKFDKGDTVAVSIKENGKFSIRVTKIKEAVAKVARLAYASRAEGTGQATVRVVFDSNASAYYFAKGRGDRQYGKDSEVIIRAVGATWALGNTPKDGSPVFGDAIFANGDLIDFRPFDD